MNYKELEEALMGALKAKDSARLSVLRMLKAAAKNEMIEKRAESLDDMAILALVRRMVKQTKEALVDFEKGGRADLTEKAKYEIGVLQELLPSSMSEEELRAIVRRKASELGVEDKSGMGKLMGAVMKEVAGRADGAAVKQVVESVWGENK